MARHTTRKSTLSGKARTCCDRQTRRIKYRTEALDIPRLAREIGAQA